MREVNHPAKNMLGVVHAIARQTVARDPEHFIERFSERIKSLSANQDLLIRNAWQGVEIEALVRAQLAPFGDFMGSRVVMSGSKLRLMRPRRKPSGSRSMSSCRRRCRVTTKMTHSTHSKTEFSASEADMYGKRNLVPYDRSFRSTCSR